MRHAAKVDANQAEIVEALRAAGCTVTTLHRVGQGCPDLLVGNIGHNLLIEVKAPGEKLNARERRWHDEWRGQVIVVESVQQAIDFVQFWGLIK